MNKGAPRYKLRVANGERNWDFPVPPEGFTLGRTSDSLIVLPFSQLSSVHLEFQRGRDGSWVVWDRESSNGSYIGSRRLEPGRRYRFDGNVTLHVGSLELELELIEDRVSIETEATPVADVQVESDVEAALAPPVLEEQEGRLAEIESILEVKGLEVMQLESRISSLVQELKERGAELRGVNEEGEKRRRELADLVEESKRHFEGLQSARADEAKRCDEAAARTEEARNILEENRRRSDEAASHFERVSVELKSKLAVLHSDRSTLEFDVARLARERATAQGEATSLKSEAERARKELVDLRDAEESARAAMRRIDAQAQELSDECSKREEEKKNLDVRIRELNEERRKSDRDCSQRRQELETRMKELDELWRKIEERRLELGSSEKQLEELRHAHQAAAEGESLARASLREAQEIEAAARAHTETLRSQDEAITRRIADLELKAIHVKESTDRLLNAELDARRAYEAHLQRLETIKTDVESAESQKRRSEVAMGTIWSEVTAAEERLKRTLEENLVTQARTDALSSECIGLRAACQSLEGDLRKLASEKEATEADLHSWERSEREKQKLIFADRAEKQERDLAERRHSAMAELEKEKEAWFKEQEGRRGRQIKEILRSSAKLFEARLVEGSVDGAQAVGLRAACLKDLEEVVRTVFNAEDPADLEARDRSKSLLAASPDAKNEALSYWRQRGLQGGVALAVLALCILVPEIPRRLVSGAQELVTRSPASSNAFAERVRLARANKPRFMPHQAFVYRDSFSDNILHLVGYAELKSDDEIKADWTLELNKFLQSRLDLDDRAIVNYMSIETPMIKELLEIRAQIHPDNPEEQISRMRDFEEMNRSRFVELVGGEEKYRELREFESRFYERYGRKLASETPEAP
jgi:hypothetical protein